MPLRDNFALLQWHARLSNIEAGEFGFLAPGMAASADIASRGKVYTFRIIE
jgi:hypothetical protein